MKTLPLSAAMTGCAILAGLSAQALPAGTVEGDTALHRAGSSDGAGLPGLPGGRGGKSGRDLAREQEHRRSRASDDDTDPRLADYCIALLKSDGRAAGPGDLGPSDCADYFTALDAARSGRRGKDAGRRGGDGKGGDGKGSDGPSIAGGQGGQGGRAGAGPGGGRGGGGGAGVAGGSGGRGGAGGGGY